MYRCSSASLLPDAVVYKQGLMDLRLKVHLTHQPHLLALAADFVLGTKSVCLLADTLCLMPFFVHLMHQPHLLALAADFVLDMLTCAEVC